MKNDEKIVITVVGVDRPGIVAMIANILAENNINIEDMRSTILQSGTPVFTMIMIADMSNSKISYEEFKSLLKKKEEETGVTLIALREEIFKFLHRI